MRLSRRCSWCGHELIAAGTPGPMLDQAHREQVREHQAEHGLPVLKLGSGSLWWKP